MITPPSDGRVSSSSSSDTVQTSADMMQIPGLKSFSRMVTLPQQQYVPETKHGFSVNFASIIMIVDTLTEYIQLESIICENYIDFVLGNEKTTNDKLLDKIVNSYLKKKTSKRKTYGGIGLIHSDKMILDNLEFGPFDKVHDWLGNRNKFFATTPGRLVPLICTSANDVAFQPPDFNLDFTNNSGGNRATTTISKILHGVDNPKNAKSIHERALKAAIALKEPARYDFYFGPSETLPSTLALEERNIISSIVNPLDRFESHLKKSFPGGKKWIYDACIGRFIRNQLGAFDTQVFGLPNIWDPSKQGQFKVNASLEHTIGNGYSLVPASVPMTGQRYFKFMKNGKDVYNDSNTGIYYKTLNNRIFKDAGITVELHMASESLEGIARALILILNGDTVSYYADVDSGFSVAELSEILLYVDTGMGPLRRSDPPRYTILKGIADHLIGLLPSLPAVKKMALIHFFLMWKYSGDDGTIKIAHLLELIYLSGDNLAFSKSIVMPRMNAVGSYLKVKDVDDDTDDNGEDDIQTPTSTQFFMAKFVPGGPDVYLRLIEETRLEIIAGLLFQRAPSPTRLTGNQIVSINGVIVNLLKSSDFFSNPGTMLGKILAIPDLHKLRNEIVLQGGTDYSVVLTALKNINIATSFVKNYGIITGTLEKMTDQIVRQLPPRVQSRRGINFSTAWNQVSKLISGVSLNLAIEQVDDTLDKQIIKMKTNIDTINDAHLKQILNLNPDMIIFIEQHMMDYRRALFSAKIQTWLGVNSTPSDREFAKQLIQRVYPGMYGGINGGGRTSSIIHHIVYVIMKRFNRYFDVPNHSGSSASSSIDVSFNKRRKTRRGGQTNKNTRTIKMRI